ncbi:hypothetical protein EYF80_036534 [Liparis tanakae]|uniref:Uncharacterized protein n=1 Tax=Liparis tanakae TaxID=230148 RepID=A0A4Z2GK62_9TELE|nr:hypothetical protein EYF80_036534 [Liparis tanakae]
MDVQTERTSGKSDKPNQAKGSKRWKAKELGWEWEGGKEGRKTNGRVGWIEGVGMTQGETKRRETCRRRVYPQGTLLRGIREKEELKAAAPHQGTDAQTSARLHYQHIN